ncbi:MAG: GGDEF domain-containing protein [Candidatus Obscuribacterales bacterium]|jgi:diguanylate cyclase|nr:GGDEF domain-containing protein [Candidatus Obscuribacterales bacterium]
MDIQRAAIYEHLAGNTNPAQMGNEKLEVVNRQSGGLGMKARITQMLQHIHGGANQHNRQQQDWQMHKNQTPSVDYEKLLREKDREIDRLRHELSNTQARLQEMMGSDLLTQLPNRHAFKDHLTHSLKRAVRLGYSLSLMLIDIDCLREINVKYGHEIGDEVLIEVSKILKNSVREIDMPARWGGEELVAVLHETDLEGAATVAERVRRKVAMLEIKDPRTGKLISLTASLAVAAYPKHSCDPQGLLEAACDGMIEAKAKGGNVVVVAV